MLRLLRRLIQLVDVLKAAAAAAAATELGELMFTLFNFDFNLLACKLKNALADETILFGFDNADGGVDGIDRSPNGLFNSFCVSLLLLLPPPVVVVVVVLLAAVLLLLFVLERSFDINTNSKRYNSCTRFFRSWQSDKST
jgi:hypothetical protein